MTPDLVPRGTAAVELLSSWQFVLGALVLTTGPAIALHRRRLALAARTDAERAEAAECRGRRIEDLLTVVVAAAAATLSASGLRRVGHHQMGLDAPFDLLPFVALDVAAMVCGRRARRRARAGDGPGVSGALFWTLATISAFFSAAEAASPLGAAVRAVWPVLAAVLWEIGSLEERRAARAKHDRPDRRIALVRLFHPVESFRVALLLAARPNLPQEDATAEVRISRVAYRWYRLRRAHDGVKDAGRWTRWAYRLAEMHADARAQHASERAGCSDPQVLEQVVARLQLRVRQADWAGMNLRTATAFEQIRGTLIGAIPPIPSRTETPHPASPSHPGPEENPQVTGRMGDGEQDGDDADGTDAPLPDPGEDAEKDEPANADPKTDEQVMAAFVAIVPRRDDGTFAWGINKVAKELGIGNNRARRFLNTQHEWLPQALQAHPATPEAAEADHGLEDHFDQAVAVANQPQPASAARARLLADAPPAAVQPPFDELLLEPHLRDGYAQLGSGLLVPAGAGTQQT
ncbi:DUF2637 domain-containing protein [Streptomyces sp. NPDC001407]|uniref:DUF2637 domain-containing protein n=1 Tax=Streptomyces sp. NPDC001407 TaxID=3364573 RepID=UPI00368E54D1